MPTLTYPENFVKYLGGGYLIHVLSMDMPKKGFVALIDKQIITSYNNNPLSYPYIQPNHKNSTRWLVFDVDKPNAYYSWLKTDAKRPNIIVQTPHTGYAHLYYMLASPVHHNIKSSYSAISFLQDTQQKMTDTLEADNNFTGLLCKNPLNECWETTFVHDYAYTLSELSENLKKTPRTKKPEYQNNFGFSRNCDLFDVCRKFVYTKIRQLQFNREPDFLMQTTIEYTMEKNFLMFNIPLNYREVTYIAKSCVLFAYKQMSHHGFMKWGDKRRLHSITIRSKKSAEKLKLIKEYTNQNPNMTLRDISKNLGIHESTIWNMIHNPEKYYKHAQPNHNQSDI